MTAAVYALVSSVCVTAMCACAARIVYIVTLSYLKRRQEHNSATEKRSTSHLCRYGWS